MTSLWAEARHLALDGRPCWLTNSQVVVPFPQIDLGPEGRITLRVMVPSPEHSLAFHQISCELAPEWLPSFARDWWQGPEEALEKWFGHQESLSWSGAAKRPGEPIIATANAEDLGL